MDGDFAKRIDLTSRNKTVGLDGRTAKFDWCSFAPLNFVSGCPLAWGGARSEWHDGSPILIALPAFPPSVAGRESEMARLKRSIADVRAKWAQQKNLYEELRVG